MTDNPKNCHLTETLISLKVTRSSSSQLHFPRIIHSNGNWRNFVAWFRMLLDSMKLRPARCNVTIMHTEHIRETFSYPCYRETRIYRGDFSRVKVKGRSGECTRGLSKIPAGCLRPASIDRRDLDSKLLPRQRRGVRTESAKREQKGGKRRIDGRRGSKSIDDGMLQLQPFEDPSSDAMRNIARVERERGRI